MAQRSGNRMTLSEYLVLSGRDPNSGPTGLRPTATSAVDTAAMVIAMRMKERKVGPYPADLQVLGGEPGETVYVLRGKVVAHCVVGPVDDAWRYDVQFSGILSLELPETSQSQPN